MTPPPILRYFSGTPTTPTYSIPPTIKHRRVSGERSTVTEEMNAPWNDTALPILLSNCKLENVFNADEFGRLY